MRPGLGQVLDLVRMFVRMGTRALVPISREMVDDVARSLNLKRYGDGLYIGCVGRSIIIVQRKDVPYGIMDENGNIAVHHVDRSKIQIIPADQIDEEVTELLRSYYGIDNPGKVLEEALSLCRNA